MFAAGYSSACYAWAHCNGGFHCRCIAAMANVAYALAACYAVAEEYTLGGEAVCKGMIFNPKHVCSWRTVWFTKIVFGCGNLFDARNGTERLGTWNGGKIKFGITRFWWRGILEGVPRNYVKWIASPDWRVRMRWKTWKNCRFLISQSYLACLDLRESGLVWGWITPEPLNGFGFWLKSITQ